MLGRKKLLMICALLFAVTGIGTGWAGSFDQFICFRMLSGVAVGAAALVCPMYVSEISPAPMRGKLVSFYQLSIVLGILVAYLSQFPKTTKMLLKMIYNKYNFRIYQIARKYLKSEIIAQEVVQDVFMKLWSERKNIKTGTPIEAWLYTVAKNNNINKLKKIANELKAINYLKDTQIAILNYYFR